MDPRFIGPTDRSTLHPNASPPTWAARERDVDFVRLRLVAESGFKEHVRTFLDGDGSKGGEAVRA